MTQEKQLHLRVRIVQDGSESGLAETTRSGRKAGWSVPKVEEVGIGGILRRLLLGLQFWAC